MKEVEFSDKYNPLFYLLDAREEYKNGNQEYKAESEVDIVLVLLKKRFLG